MIIWSHVLALVAVEVSLLYGLAGVPSTEGTLLPSFPEFSLREHVVLQSTGVPAQLGLTDADGSRWAAAANRDIREFGNQLQRLQERGASDKERLEFADRKDILVEAKIRNRELRALNKSQRQRLRQLTLQYFGPLMLRFPELARIARISGLTRQKLVREAAGLEAYANRLNARWDRLNSQSLRKWMQTSQKTPPAGRKLHDLEIENERLIERRRAKLSAKSFAWLDTEQRARWKSMVGTPFKFTPKSQDLEEFYRSEP